MTFLKKAGSVSALVLAAALLGTVHGRAAGSSVTFTAGQVSVGAAAFQTHCSACHGTNLEGGAGPALTGPNFKTLSTKVKAKVSDIFGYMTMNMPLNEPASLSHTEYVNILAFILSKNGYRPGRAPLTFASANASTAPIVRP